MRTLLVVDDYEGVRAALEFALPFYGVRVLTADSGKRALEVAATGTVDAVLLDVMMPGMDGFQTCAALLEQARVRGQRLPIWMVSGVAHTGAEKRALEVGAVCLLGKPFDVPQFIAEVDRWWANPPPGT